MPALQKTQQHRYTKEHGTTSVAMFVVALESWPLPCTHTDTHMHTPTTKTAAPAVL